MAELAINNIIKIVLGVFVLVAVIAGVFLIFKTYIIPAFNSSDGGDDEIYTGPIFDDSELQRITSNPPITSMVRDGKWPRNDRLYINLVGDENVVYNEIGSSDIKVGTGQFWRGDVVVGKITFPPSKAYAVIVSESPWPLGSDWPEEKKLMDLVDGGVLHGNKIYRQV